MSSPISALPTGNTTVGLDFITGIGGGVNYKMTRDMFFSTWGAAPIVIGNGFGALSISQFGSVGLGCPAGQNLELVYNANIVLGVNAFGVVELNAQAGVELMINGNGAVIRLTGAGGIELYPGFGQVVDMQYIAAVTGDWAGSPPIDVISALDRIASYLHFVGGSPIP